MKTDGWKQPTRPGLGRSFVEYLQSSHHSVRLHEIKFSENKCVWKTENCFSENVISVLTRLEIDNPITILIDSTVYMDLISENVEHLRMHSSD